ncbi:MAG: prepilin-type N-terminal cleavage/methylation domain-containing protein [Firmicutes bacterium]|nr:prepilin-type N-terminal cleavage/methylation domain-containing protein [Bacillota bacterium]
MRSQRSKKGFTLAELLIVIAIIAVLVAVAVPVFSANLDRAREATCKANRRSLYGQVVSEHILSGRPYSEIFDQYVGSAGICPCEGTFSWEDEGETGKINCSFHDGGGSGGSGSGSGGSGGSSGGSEGSSGSGSSGAPALHTTPHLSQDTITRGSVIQDETGTCVILQGLWGLKTAYASGAKVAELAAQYTTDAMLVDTSDIKDSTFTGTLKVGDLYYDSTDGTYYYVTLVSLYESWPNTSWQPLIQ